LEYLVEDKMRSFLILIVATCLYSVSPQPVEAFDADAQAALEAPFDARPLTTSEKRLLQTGLKVFGDYVGLIDGEWGGRSQRALQAYAAEQFPKFYDPVAGPSGLHATLLASQAQKHLSDNDLGYRVAPGTPVALIAPSDPFTSGTLWADGPPSQDIAFAGLKVLVAPTDGATTALMHDTYLGLHVGTDEPYVVRGDQRLVTSVTLNSAFLYVRSEPFNTRWYSALVIYPRDLDLGLFRLVTSSLAWEPTAAAYAPKTGMLSRMYARLEQVVADSERRAPSAPAAMPAPPPPEGFALVPPAPAPSSSEAQAQELRGTGTAFYVNNTDLVSAAHVIEGCQRVTLLAGQELRVVSVRPDIDLALLTGTERSRAWLSLNRAGTPLLGQKIYALGYPYFGVVGTSLNLTAGNVSALSGARDDPTTFTISAPVQPGNSGGPLLDARGAIVGVVVARLAKEGFGDAAPENVNYATRGDELLRFLRAEGVLFPSDARESWDMEHGVPAEVEKAVVPLLCW
jgi:S1-C subfamily serine protease